MRKWLAAALLGVVLDPSPAAAWGFVGHQLIMRRAIDLLPAEIKPFFERHREEVVLRVIDPDLWRTMGWPEDPARAARVAATVVADGLAVLDGDRYRLPGAGSGVTACS